MGTIADRIKKAMEIRNIKQSELAFRTGIGKSSISTYLSGEYEPKQKNIYKIAKALDVNEGWLMGEDIPMDRLDLDEIMRAIRQSNEEHKQAVEKLGFGVDIVNDNLVFREYIGKKIVNDQMSILLTLYNLNKRGKSAEKNIRTLRILGELVSVMNPEDQDKVIAFAEFTEMEGRKRDGLLPVKFRYQTEGQENR